MVSRMPVWRRRLQREALAGCPVALACTGTLEFGTLTFESRALVVFPYNGGSGTLSQNASKDSPVRFVPVRSESAKDTQGHPA